MREEGGQDEAAERDEGVQPGVPGVMRADDRGVAGDIGVAGAALGLRGQRRTFSGFKSLCITPLA